MGIAKMQTDGTCLYAFVLSIELQFQLDIINLASYKSSTFKYKFGFSCRA